MNQLTYTERELLLETCDARRQAGGITDDELLAARHEAVTVRLEPFCDTGFLTKPDRDRFEYRVADRPHMARSLSAGREQRLTSA